MQITARVHDITKDWRTGKTIVSFASDIDAEDADKYRDKLLDVEFKQHRDKRSLTANAYAWALLQKMAEAIGDTNKEECYLYCLKTYSRKFTNVVVASEAIPMLKQVWREVVDLGEVEEGKHELQLYYGSHMFDSKEMAVFIDGIVRECRDLGIPTMPTTELERLKSLWQKA